MTKSVNAKQITRDGKPAVTVLLGKGFHALIDLDDLPLIQGYKWRAKLSCDIWYAVASVGRNGSVTMHRLITGAPDGTKVDHESGDGLDNRRDNLRLCTNAQNIRNARKYRRANGKITSAMKGVYLDKQTSKYRAQIMHVGRKINLGNYPNEEAAGRAYDEAASKLFGQFARLNFPQEQPTNA